jgi:hypothetical protein
MFILTMVKHPVAWELGIGQEPSLQLLFVLHVCKYYLSQPLPRG